MNTERDGGDEVELPETRAAAAAGGGGADGGEPGRRSGGKSLMILP